MRDAEVGDDVFGEDPTVNRLEARAAELAGKPAALFVPSGTMANQIAIAVHTVPGQEIICDEHSHVVLYEMGMLARLSGCVSRTVAARGGILSWELIRPRVRPSSGHYRGTGLIELENTHNQAGGRAYPLAALSEIRSGARKAGLPVHMDGARVFHAAAASGAEVSAIAAHADSISFCLSKGLGAPVGSLLAGTAEFVAEARLARKALGGGMRQAGVLAAAGLVALERSPANIGSVHADARFLAESLAAMPGIRLDATAVETNIVFFDVAGTGLTGAEFVQALRNLGVLALALGRYRIRMVTHQDVGRSDCERAVVAARSVCSAAAPR